MSAQKEVLVWSLGRAESARTGVTGARVAGQFRTIIGLHWSAGQVSLMPASSPDWRREWSFISAKQRPLVSLNGGDPIAADETVSRCCRIYEVVVQAMRSYVKRVLLPEAGSGG